jgi:hypothetical protein
MISIRDVLMGSFSSIGFDGKCVLLAHLVT